MVLGHAWDKATTMMAVYRIWSADGSISASVALWGQRGFCCSHITPDLLLSDHPWRCVLEVSPGPLP